MFRYWNRIVVVVAGMLISSVGVYAEGMLGYYRYPAIHGNMIVFTAEGDLWTVSVEGGLARRLTTHLGVESGAEISPDGETIAFEGQYEGGSEVYTMPVTGGVPIRRTYGAERCMISGWSSDGKVIYSSRHKSTLPSSQLFLLDVKNNQEEQLPLSQAAQGTYGDNGTLFFTRLPVQPSHTKRYKGGSVEQIWKFDARAKEAIPLTQDYTGTSRDAMWWHKRIYFASDRDGTMNLWSMNAEGEDLIQHTRHSGWDIKSPSLGEGRIVYQAGADLYLYDIATNSDKKLAVTLSSDFDHMRNQWIDNPNQFLESSHVSPKGDRVVLTSRGRVFVAPTKQGRFVEVTRNHGVRYRNAKFMPDGKTLLLQSDETGEIEFWTAPANGVGQLENMTKDATVFRNSGVPSPDGNWVAFTDRDQKLWLLDVNKKTTKMIGKTPRGYYDLAWSPDSQWLACAAAGMNTYPRIHLFKLATGTEHIITSDRVNSYSPAWSPDGKWLYFLSDRNFQSTVGNPWGSRQPDPFFDKTTQIYQLALKPGLRSQFLPNSEMTTPIIDDKNSEDKKGKKDETPKEKKESKVQVEITLDGIQSRIYEVPVEPGTYRNLAVTEKHLYFTDQGNPSRKRNNNGDRVLSSPWDLVVVPIANEEVEKTVVVAEIEGYELSGDGKKMMVRKGRNTYVIDASGKEEKKLGDVKVNLSEWKFTISPREEWKQMLVDAWRLERDYFYDPNMHGVDWKGQLDRHLPLVARLTDRDELDDLIADMVGELEALHIYIIGGDKRRGDDQIGIASLGAEWVRDEAMGGYRVTRIYKGDPDYLERLSPLQRPEVDVKEGEVISAINGVPTLSVSHLSELLKNQAGNQVLLHLTSVAGKGRDVIVEPISASRAQNLRYDDWEVSRRNSVEAAGNGEIGYVHLRAMGSNDVAQWTREYYPVFDRKGLILDMRHNRGGNIDSWILGKLLRQAWFYWKERDLPVYWNMQYAFRGHMVVLCNELTASDGEAFAEGFRRLGLGKVIGVRTWGGEIWLDFSNPLVDKGIATAAQAGVFGPESKWLIEGHGVDPDIVVDNLPHETFGGRDAQLEAAIAYLKSRIVEEPVNEPEAPPFPVKH
jgi:tricorn protease